MPRKKRSRGAGEDLRVLSDSVSDGIQKKVRRSADMRRIISDSRAGAEGAVKDVELSGRILDNAHDDHVSQSPQRKKRKKQNGGQEGPAGDADARLEANSCGVSAMQIDEEGLEAQSQGASEWEVSFSGAVSKLELVRLLQNSKIAKSRKIKAAYKVIKDWEETMCTESDRTPQVSKDDSMGMPQFLSFLFDWGQNAILWASKHGHPSYVREGEIVLPYLDSRYWSVLSWCLSSNHLSQSASVSPGLMRCLDEFVKYWVGPKLTEGEWITEDSVRSIEVLLLATQRSFRPDLDHWVSLAITALSTLTFRDEWFAECTPENCILLFRLFVNILEGFSRFIGIYPNRKKTFLCLVENLLTPLLRAHAYLDMPSDLTRDTEDLYAGRLKIWKKRFLTVTEEILEKGLFHSVHLGSFHEVCTFLSGKVDLSFDTRNAKIDSRKDARSKKLDEGRDMTSYQKLLFRKLDQLREEVLTATPFGLAVTQIGWIFKTYSQKLTGHQADDAVEIFGFSSKRKRQLPPSNVSLEKIDDSREEESGKVVDTSSAGPKSVDWKDQNRKARFAVFAELTGPILTDLQSSWSAAGSTNGNNLLSRAEVFLSAFNGLLETASIEQTYVPTEDSVKQTHFTFLSHCFRVVVDFGMFLLGLVPDSDGAIAADSKAPGELADLIQSNVDVEIPRSLIGRLLEELILAIAHLLELEYRVADNSLEDVWAILLQGANLKEVRKKEGKGEIGSEAVKVACQIFSTYSDLRQVDRALFTLCRTLRRFIDEPSTFARQNGINSISAAWSLRTSPEASGVLTYTKLFLSVVASAVNTLPEGQVAGFIRLLTADAVGSMKAIEETMRSRQEGLDTRAEHGQNSLLSQVCLIELYSHVLENVNITAMNSLLCCQAVGSFIKEVVVTSVGELIDSCLSTGNHQERHAGSFETGERLDFGKTEKEIEGSMKTWNVIFKLRMFIATRALHRQCLYLMPPKAVKKANIAFGGYLVDYHKLDIESIVSGLSAGMFFSAVDRDGVKVSDFLAGLKAKINESQLLECPALDYTLDRIAMESLVDLSRHVESVSFLAVRYSDVSRKPEGEKVSSRSPSEGNEPHSLPEAEVVDVEVLKKLQKLYKSLKQESRRLAKTLLQGLPPLTDACQLVSLHCGSSELLSASISELGSRSNSQLTDSPGIPRGSSGVEWRRPIWDHVDATLSAESLTVRRWCLLCETFDVWAKFAADKDMKKFLSCLLACSMMTQKSHFSNRQKDGETCGPEITVMQQAAADLLTNACFFEEEDHVHMYHVLARNFLGLLGELQGDVEFKHSVLTWFHTCLVVYNGQSIRRLFASSFLETFESLASSAFGKLPLEWFPSATSMEKEAVFKVAREFSDLVEAQMGETEGEEDLRAFPAKKSLAKKRKNLKIEACELKTNALRDCIALLEQLAALPSGYMISSEATRCAYALQCFERLLVQSILHERLTALETQQGANRTATVDSSNVLVVLEGLCSCRSALLALTSTCTGVKFSNNSDCSLMTFLAGSSPLVKWLSQSLLATATCLVDIVERSNLAENEKLNRLSLGESLLHIALKWTASLLTYIYDEGLQPEFSKRQGKPIEHATTCSDGNKDIPNFAADRNGVVNVTGRSFLDDLLRCQGTKIDELVQKRVNVGQISNSDRPELAGNLCRGEFKRSFNGLVLAVSLSSYFWSLVSSFGKHARDVLVPEDHLMLALESGGNIDTLGHTLVKALVRALVPDGSHAMLLVGDTNLQWTALEVTEGKEAFRPHTLQDDESRKRDEDETESESDDFQTSDLVEPAEQDIKHVLEEEEEEDVKGDDTLDVEQFPKEEDQGKVANGIDLEERGYSNKSAPQREALKALLDGRCTGICDLVGELYLATAGFVKLEALKLSRSKEASKFSGGLPPGASVLLGAGYWILLRAAKQIRSGQCSTRFGWLVGVVKYMESVGSFLPHLNSPLTAAAFEKLFSLHLYLLGSLSSAELEDRSQRLSQPLDTIYQLEVPAGFESPSDGLIKDEAERTLKEAVKVSLSSLMKTASRHHSVLALQAITRALVGASEESYLTSGLELSGHESGTVGRGVAAGVQSLSIALEAVSGTKRLRLLANHFREFSGAIFNLIECLAGPKLFLKHDMPHHGTLLTEHYTGMVQSAPVILRCIQIMSSIASRETIYPLKASYVALALHCPARIFSPVYESGSSEHRVTRSFLAYGNSGVKQEKEAYSTILRIGTDVGVELYVACCRLLCSLIRHRRRESGHCIHLLGDSARVLLHCLEATYWPMSEESTKVWSTRMATYCALWLRRIYEEMGEHKETLGKYCCHILSNYLSVLAGHGPHAVGLTREVEAALRPGAYALVDACSPNDLQQLHASLGEGPRRNALLALRREYAQQFQYTGKV